MRNPFTMLKVLINWLLSLIKRKPKVIESIVNSPPVQKIDIFANSGHTYMRQRDNRKRVNRMRNKVARKSRRINKLKAA